MSGEKTIDGLIALATEQSVKLLGTLEQLVAATQDGSFAYAAADIWLKRASELLPRLAEAAKVAHAEDVRPKRERVKLGWMSWESRETKTMEVVKRTSAQVILRHDYPYKKEERFRLSDGRSVDYRKTRNCWRICNEDLEKLRVCR